MTDAQLLTLVAAIDRQTEVLANVLDALRQTAPRPTSSAATEPDGVFIETVNGQRLFISA